jgi:predicted nucleic acid-binding protein
MIILDTNVISELRRPDHADPAVIRWAADVPVEHLFLSVITIFEIERGIHLMQASDPAQANVFRTWLHSVVYPRFHGRILPIDVATAQRCAALRISSKSDERDAMIAATALVHGMQVATRNTPDFSPMGVQLINPWHFN